MIFVFMVIDCLAYILLFINLYTCCCIGKLVFNQTKSISKSVLFGSSLICIYGLLIFHFKALDVLSQENHYAYYAIGDIFFQTIKYSFYFLTIIFALYLILKYLIKKSSELNIYKVIMASLLVLYTVVGVLGYYCYNLQQQIITLGLNNIYARSYYDVDAFLHKVVIDLQNKETPKKFDEYIHFNDPHAIGGLSRPGKIMPKEKFISWVLENIEVKPNVTSGMPIFTIGDWEIGGVPEESIPLKLREAIQSSEGPIVGSANLGYIYYSSTYPNSNSYIVHESFAAVPVRNVKTSETNYLRFRILKNHKYGTFSVTCYVDEFLKEIMEHKVNTKINQRYNWRQDNWSDG
ncbi:hypothetical protein [Pelosinus propionicus]|uniref:Uncharacterized protein n=1 Tax=Pelosinus propionicus DSM 13327 TaxID=1123291 RepID=A0A1I4K9F1_9FIRM|nr:hypothetical protein [Pelosinus propionicus]SFL75432.1 hypothetical protein SAMN04490355_101670 [Pelosinus propionicus DSM 13327]